MKRTVITVIALLFISSSWLSAQFTPYGSTRIGFWYENEDEEWSGVPDGRLNLNYYLQGNSRFGGRFHHGDLEGRVEFGGTGNIRHLWAKYSLAEFSVMIGQNETLLTQKGTMNFNGENNFVGWGAIDDGRIPQIRIEMENGFSAAILQPQLTDVENIVQEKTTLLPKINLGYEGRIADNMALCGALGMNIYNYDEDAGPRDETVMSFVAALMLGIDVSDEMNIKLHGNFGQNTGNYGLSSQTYNKAIWNRREEEIVDVTTFGGFAEFSYELSEILLMTLGASYTMSDSDYYDDADTAMAAFGKLRYSLGNGFSLSPEIGMLNKMEDVYGNEQGSLTYFGTQLRMDF